MTGGAGRGRRDSGSGDSGPEDAGAGELDGWGGPPTGSLPTAPPPADTALPPDGPERRGAAQLASHDTAHDTAELPPAGRRQEPEVAGKRRPASRRAIDLVAAYGVAQWNVVQVKLMGGADADFRLAKERQIAAYGALMAYIAELEARTPGDG